MPLRALLVGSDEPGLEPLGGLLAAEGFETDAAASVEAAKERLEDELFDLVVIDLDLEDGAALGLLEDVGSGLGSEVVVLASEDALDTAARALQSGVHDFLAKPVGEDDAKKVLKRVKRTLSLHREVTELRDSLRRLGRFDRLVGSSPAMQEVYDLIARVARTPSTVLITGETGTGKDVTAETIHRLSRRAEGPFVAVNCGAIQPTLIESELFGHAPGSFTGATKTRHGVFEQADGGTLFLDEITEMPPDLQVKLLRVLESRTITRVGGEKSIEVDVRLVAATNQDAESAVEDGTLRQDLYFRLKVFPIRLPSLRERPEDLDLLASYFLSELNEEAGTSKRFDPRALDRLRKHDWPGNVRELRNVVERASILAEDRIGPDHVQVGESGAPAGDGEALDVAPGMTIAEAEKRLILATLESLDGDKRKAAKTLGISLKTLYNRLNVYEAAAREAGK